MADFIVPLPDGRDLPVTGVSTPEQAYAAAKLFLQREAKAPQSGDEIRANRAGDTRATMRPEDISNAYDFAQGRGDRPEAEKMAEAYVRREQADSPTMMGVADTARAIARGVPIAGPAADEVNAFLNSPLSAMGLSDGGQSYEKALDYQRARDRLFDADRPLTSLGLQVGGGVGTGLGAAGALTRAASALPRGAAVLAGGATGAGVGAVDGFLAGEGGAGERATNAIPSAAIGGIVGAAAPLAVEGIQKGVQGISDYLVQRDTLNKLGLSRPSAKVLMRAMDADGSLGPQGAANVRAAGAGAMVADAGPNAKAVLDTVIQRGGKGANEARTAVADRAKDAAKGIDDALDTAFGTPYGVNTVETAIRKGSAPARSAAYKAAYSKPIDYADPVGQEVEDLLTRVPKSAIDEANRLMNVRGEKSAQILVNVEPDGSFTFKSMPDVRQVDYITRALNEVADAADGQGKLGGQTAYGNAVRELSTEIRDRVRTLVPEYDNALATAAEPIAARKALRLGEEFLSPSLPRDEAVREVGRMTKPEREALKQGIRSKIDETLANVKRTATDPDVDARQGLDALKALSSDAARYKVKAALGAKEADDLFKKVDEFASAFELKAATARNSATFARTSLNDTIKDVTAPGPVGTLMQGEPVTASRKLVQAVLGNGPERQTARQDQIYDEVARLLTNPRGAKAVQFIRDLEDALRRQGQGQLLGEVLAKITAGAGVGGGYRAIEQANRAPQSPRP
jgi:hypothetical protein